MLHKNNNGSGNQNPTGDTNEEKDVAQNEVDRFLGHFIDWPTVLTAQNVEKDIVLSSEHVHVIGRRIGRSLRNTLIS